MKLRRVPTDSGPALQIETARGWTDVSAALAALKAPPDAGGPDLARDLVALLAAPQTFRDELLQAAEQLGPSPERTGAPLLPFAPRSFRDFMLYERHAIDAARGFARRFMPRLVPLIRAFEAVAKRPFPMLRPKPIWYRQPIYYLGNHLVFIADGADVAWPSYSTVLDYELEIGFILARPLRDASPAEAERAIGGFVLFNDVSARDVQREEMLSGFGPQKAKHFCNTMAAVVVSADEILPRFPELAGRVRINGEVVAEVRAAGPQHTLGEALAHASRGEQLHPGELFGTGTLPGGSGIENGALPKRGDTVELSLDGLGTLTNRYG
jgi:2-keto-4-pentenoate hydratase/2-oxohepta-3-ene-1,7-dioic acid hydratase in catechol pathway